MLATVLQQGICTRGGDVSAYVSNFEFVKAFPCVFADAIGWLVMGLMVYGAISLSLYIRTESLLIPAVLLLVVGGAVLGQMAAIASPFAVLVLVGVPGGLVALAYYIYSR